MEDIKNRSILVTRPGSDQVVLVVAIVLDPDAVDVERLLSGLVPELAKGGVPAGLLVVGDSTLVIRTQRGEIVVDEVDTTALLSLASIDEPWSRTSLLSMMQLWVTELATSWRDRILDQRLREVLVPHVVAGLGGNAEVVEGIWGIDSHRVASPA
jgi:hypothetical protein